ncbi:GNAT family N-acetyltransferase [Oceanobacillus sp. 1P07AA]|uniref:GNAT family N-acetyltransferase n=1 Tax=Oceanobacillus sp. 1P07AA TaxID=3132293 RepID=UPI0039A4CBC9
MNVQLINATKDKEETLLNLFQFYIYDFSEFMEIDIEPNGRFAEYPINDYLEKENYYTYFVSFNDSYIGFCIIQYNQNEGDKQYFSVKEFFIMKRYRRMGIGKFVANKVFNMHQGCWEVFQMKSNLPAQRFWSKVIRHFTKGDFTERRR